ncbi:MAG: hypothetical protein QHH06_03950 [Clostridiales bacterium]|jgi:septation ring formation regulator EzrA|nr:hypothetical protein [Eubacteriales bacterium]MDH7565619.1 hypothetical protein [Clostridiales bacterium]
MEVQTNRSAYKRPAIRSGGSKDKNYHMRAYALSSELSRLEYERQMAETRMARIERRIEQVQREILEINAYFRQQYEIVEEDVIPPSRSRTKHITFEY